MEYRFRCPKSISRRLGPGSAWDDLLASYVTRTDGSQLFFLNVLKAQSLKKLVKVIFGSDSFPFSPGWGPFKHLKMHLVYQSVLHRKPGDNPMLTLHLIPEKTKRVRPS